MGAEEKADLLVNLLQNEEFLGRFNDVEDDIAKTKELFASEGLSLSDDQLEVIIDALRAAKKSMYTGEPLDDGKMDEISGGGIVKSAAKKILALAIFGATIYGGYKIYNGVKEKGGIKNEKVNKAIDTAKNLGQEGLDKAKDAVEKGADKVVELLTTSGKKEEN